MVSVMVSHNCMSTLIPKKADKSFHVKGQGDKRAIEETTTREAAQPPVVNSKQRPKGCEAAAGSCFPKEMNILVLGETGIGKSTWINISVNYFKYGTMDQARGNGVEVLSPTKFTQLDGDLKKTVVEYNSTIAGPEDQKANEDTTAVKSSTKVFFKTEKRVTENERRRDTETQKQRARD